MAGIESLPPEVLSRILEYEPAFYGVRRGVNQQFLDLTDEIIEIRVSALARRFINKYNVIPKAYRPVEDIVNVVAPLLTEMALIISSSVITYPEQEHNYTFRDEAFSAGSNLYRLADEVAWNILGIDELTLVSDMDVLYPMEKGTQHTVEKLKVYLVQELSRMMGDES